MAAVGDNDGECQLGCGSDEGTAVGSNELVGNADPGPLADNRPGSISSGGRYGMIPVVSKSLGSLIYPQNFN